MARFWMPSRSPGYLPTRLGRHRNPSLSPATQREEVMRHLVVAGVNDLVVHREHEHVVEEALHQRLEIGHGLAVDVALLAERRGIRCLLYTSDAADERSSVDLG